ncbi:hypothetical protein GCM10020367_15340 [Streptomyces sannanensis]|uniref:Protein kilB n=2 Tax=Streptomyces sannanensis TaxID=285536 RepID=A0ABP6S882_9ACTN
MGTALIAVVGTLLGSVATYWFQWRTTERAAVLTRAEKLRQERIAAYSTFASALVDLRHGEYDRWHRTREDPGSRSAEEARLESYRLRSIAQQELIHLKLVCDEPAVVQLAEEAMKVTACIHDAPDDTDRSLRSDQSRQALAKFIEAASPGVR